MIPRLFHFRVANSHLQVGELEVLQDAICNIHLIIASSVLNRLSSQLMSCLEKLDEPNEPNDNPFFVLRDGDTLHRICVFCIVRPHLFPTRCLF